MQKRLSTIWKTQNEKLWYLGFICIDFQFLMICWDIIANAVTAKLISTLCDQYYRSSKLIAPLKHFQNRKLITKYEILNYGLTYIMLCIFFFAFWSAFQHTLELWTLMSRRRDLLTLEFGFCYFNNLSLFVIPRLVVIRFACSLMFCKA